MLSCYMCVEKKLGIAPRQKQPATLLCWLKIERVCLGLILGFIGFISLQGTTNLAKYVSGI